MHNDSSTVSTHIASVCLSFLNSIMVSDEPKSYVLIVTRLDHKVEWTSRPESYKWAKELCQDIVESASRTFQGELKTVIPLRSVITGFQYKIVLLDVPEDFLAEVLLPGLEHRGCVVRKLDDESAAIDRKRSEKRLHDAKEKCDQIGDTEKTTDLLTSLLALYGTGGAEEKRQKFSADAMEVAKISFRIGGATLKEGAKAAE